jgi:glycerophosphoryl diester phosphodiesterase
VIVRPTPVTSVAAVDTHAIADLPGHAADQHCPATALDESWLDPFTTWTWWPTGIGFLDVPIDIITKILLSPLLLFFALTDGLFGAHLFDAVHNGILLFRFRNDSPEDLLAFFRSKPDHEATAMIQRLSREGDLTVLLALMDESLEDRVLPLVLAKLSDPSAAAHLIALLIDDPQHARAVDRLVLRSASMGFLEETISRVRALRPSSPALSGLARRAYALKRPLIIAHRGLPRTHPENTMPSFKAAMKQGADGLEIDLCVTRDGRIVLWHDNDPDDAVALLRQSGAEPGMAYHPVVPLIVSKRRKSVHEQDYAAFREGHGYETNSVGGILLSRRRIGEIPTLEQFAGWAGTAKGIKRIFLDIKLPVTADRAADRSRNSQFGAQAAMLLMQAGLADRVIVSSTHIAVVRDLQEAMGPTFHYALDHEIVTMHPDPSDVDGMIRGGFDTASVGMPRVGIDAREAFREGLYRQEDVLPAERPEVIGWTLNEVEDWQGALGANLFDGVITDEPGAYRAWLDDVFAKVTRVNARPACLAPDVPQRGP